jgi:hypothetical protein
MSDKLFVWIWKNKLEGMEIGDAWVSVGLVQGDRTLFGFYVAWYGRKQRRHLLLLRVPKRLFLDSTYLKFNHWYGTDA